jgi:DNA mismatch endonuclease (patch repair protein)
VFQSLLSGACNAATIVLNMDTVSPAKRSEIMALIRSQNTGPEMIVRRFLHAAGLRYCLHSKNLSGKPDLVFPSRRLCVFVHGCFWHGCRKCADGTRKVKSRSAYWEMKIKSNHARDRRQTKALLSSGWAVLVIWECDVKKPTFLAKLVATIRKRAVQPYKKRTKVTEQTARTQFHRQR